jgi:hypothetical protein
VILKPVLVLARGRAQARTLNNTSAKPERLVNLATSFNFFLNEVLFWFLCRLFWFVPSSRNRFARRVLCSTVCSDFPVICEVVWSETCDFRRAFERLGKCKKTLAGGIYLFSTRTRTHFLPSFIYIFIIIIINSLVFMRLFSHPSLKSYCSGNTKKPEHRSKNTVELNRFSPILFRQD